MFRIPKPCSAGLPGDRGEEIAPGKNDSPLRYDPNREPSCLCLT